MAKRAYNRKAKTNGTEFGGMTQEMIGYARQHLQAQIEDGKAKLARLNEFANSYGTGTATTTTTATPATATTPTGRPKRQISAAGRKRISEMMKKRWANRKDAAPATTEATAPETSTETPTTAKRGRKASNRKAGRPRKGAATTTEASAE
jgi:hypothetical protein